MKRKPAAVIAIVVAGLGASAVFYLRQHANERCVDAVNSWANTCFNGTPAEVNAFEFAGFDLDGMAANLGNDRKTVRTLLLFPCALARMGAPPGTIITLDVSEHRCASGVVVCATAPDEKSAATEPPAEIAFACESGKIVRSSLVDGQGKEGAGLTDGKCGKCEWP